MNGNSTDSITIRVPASTSNLGPGFDTFGVALNLHNRVRVAVTRRKGVTITSAITKSARDGATAMLEEAAALFFRKTRQHKVGLDVSLSGEVPIARGLGSSVTARAGVLAGLNELTDAGCTRQQLFEWVARLEGHPDNAAPAIFGGFTIAGIVGKAARCVRFRIPSKVKLVTLIPHFEVSTEQARRLVPESFSKADTVHNINRAAWVSAAFVSGEFQCLRGMFDDRIHQPYRRQLIPQLFRVIAAGEKAGAIGGWLSGSGSTIVCLTLENAKTVASAMQRALPDSQVHVLSVDNSGFRVV